MGAAKRAGATMNAIALLEADHKKVQKAFKDFEKLEETGKSRAKAAIVQQTCADLIVHTKVEEELFCPAVRRAIRDGALMDEATVEHAGRKV